MIFLKRTFNFRHSRDIRDVGLAAGFISDSDHPIVYVEDYVGFKVKEQIPDQAIEKEISNALSNQLDVSNPIYATNKDADHPDYANKCEELVAKYEGAHPD